jgi:hypothetical protein
MRFQQKEFTESLKQDIEKIEAELKRDLENWLPHYQDEFLQNYRILEAGIEKEGTDRFLPGAKSSLYIKVSDDYHELIDMHVITIWTCERYFLGIPITQHLPGSKLAGELLDLHPAQIKEELQAYIENFIQT